MMWNCIGKFQHSRKLMSAERIQETMESTLVLTVPSGGYWTSFIVDTGERPWENLAVCSLSGSLERKPRFHSKSTHLLQWIASPPWTIAFRINRSDENKMLPTKLTMLHTESCHMQRTEYLSYFNTTHPQLVTAMPLPQPGYFMASSSFIYNFLFFCIFLTILW
jgi:hypothetical protein